MAQTLEERIQALEFAFAEIRTVLVREEFIEPPKPVARVFPETTAENCDWFDEPTSSGMVHVAFDYSCGVCGEQFHEAIRVPNYEPNPFSRLLPCPNKHVTKVRFYREKK